MLGDIFSSSCSASQVNAHSNHIRAPCRVHRRSERLSDRLSASCHEKKNLSPKIAFCRRREQAGKILIQAKNYNWLALAWHKETTTKLKKLSCNICQLNIGRDNTGIDLHLIDVHEKVVNPYLLDCTEDELRTTLPVMRSYSHLKNHWRNSNPKHKMY